MACNILESDKYVVKTNDVYGRYLVAAKDLNSGEIILKDEAIVIGPKFNSDVVCLNCFKQLQRRFNCCSKCKLAPLCSSECENGGGWHKEFECEFFKCFENRLTVPMLLDSMQIVTILRCFLLRHDGTRNWEKFMSLENHLEIRRHTNRWKIHEKTSQILHDLNVVDDIDMIDELVQKVCGALDVNNFELRASDFQTGSKIDTICGLYPLAAFMAHSCIANTHLSIDENYQMIIRASVPIKKDSPIFFNYSDPLQGSLNRRDHLRAGKYFECCCERCSDPTELGTHLSSLKCKKCKNEHVVMKNPLNKTQLTKNDEWHCLDCGYSYNGEDIKQIFGEIRTFSIDIDKNDINGLEDYRRFAIERVNLNHHLILDIKHTQAGLIRSELNKMPQQTKKLLQKKLDICNDFIPILTILEPGLSRLKAIILYEIHIPIVNLSNKEYDSKDINSSMLLEKLQSAEAYLKESIKMLLIEPVASPEGALCKRAIDEMKLLKNAIENVKTRLNKEAENSKNVRVRRMKGKLNK